MKVEITTEGNLLFVPESQTEEYALIKWYNDNIDCDVQDIYDRKIIDWDS